MQGIRPQDRVLRPLVRLLPLWITPNHVSGLRLALTAPIVLLMYFHFYKTAGTLFLLAALLDTLDGAMSRIREQTTLAGAFLDPLADKMVNFAVFLGFLFYIKSNIYLGLILAIIAIDLILFTISLLKHLVKAVLSKKSWLSQRIEVIKTGANNYGKTKMVLQVVVLAVLLLFDPALSIIIHERYLVLPRFTLLHMAYPILFACIVFGILSLIGHLKDIGLKKHKA